MYDSLDSDVALIEQSRSARSKARRDSSFNCVAAVVLRINYADTSDHRASAVGALDVDSYGSPTAEVFVPSSGNRVNGVRILQHGSARRNMSVWLPSVSTHYMDGTALYVAKLNELTGDAIEPIELVKPTSVYDFDGDIVIVQTLRISEDHYENMIIGTMPHIMPARERLHYAPTSRQTAEARRYDPNYEPKDGEGMMSLRASRLSSLAYVHPLMGVHPSGSLPEREGLSPAEFIQETHKGDPDRMIANPVGDERYMAHNGTLLRLDRQGNVTIDTTLAGVKNNQQDYEASSVFGDAGHIDINLCRRVGQGFSIRLGGEVVFSIKSDGANSVVELGAALAEGFSAVLGERLEAVFDNHQHMTAQGPTTVPLPVQDPLTAGSFPDVPPIGTMKPSNIGSANESADHAVLTDKVLVRS
jgi:hypothetical protein